MPSWLLCPLPLNRAVSQKRWQKARLRKQLGMISIWGSEHPGVRFSTRETLPIIFLGTITRFDAPEFGCFPSVKHCHLQHFSIMRRGVPRHHAHSAQIRPSHAAAGVFTWPIVGSLVSSIWNTGGGRVCCSTCRSCCGCPHTATAFVRWSTPFSYSPAGDTGQLCACKGLCQSAALKPSLQPQAMTTQDTAQLKSRKYGALV